MATSKPTDLIPVIGADKIYSGDIVVTTPVDVPDGPQAGRHTIASHLYTFDVSAVKGHVFENFIIPLAIRPKISSKVILREQSTGGFGYYFMEPPSKEDIEYYRSLGKQSNEGEKSQSSEPTPDPEVEYISGFRCVPFQRCLEHQTADEVMKYCIIVNSDGNTLTVTAHPRDMLPQVSSCDPLPIGQLKFFESEDMIPPHKMAFHKQVFDTVNGWMVNNCGEDYAYRPDLLKLQSYGVLSRLIPDMLEAVDDILASAHRIDFCRTHTTYKDRPMTEDVLRELRAEVLAVDAKLKTARDKFLARRDTEALVAR